MVNNSAFGILEDKILERSDEKNNIFDIYLGLGDLKSKLTPSFGEVLKYTLATSVILEQQGMLESYFHIGGGATLLHIANTIGIENISSWRGTHDMDIIVTNYGVRGALESFFSEYEEYNSSSIKNKKKIEIKDPTAKDKVQLDLYLPTKNQKNINIDGTIISSRMLKELKTINVLGIKTRVPKLHDLLAMKINISTEETGLPRSKDMSDIINLIGCIERNQDIKEKYNTNEDLAGYLYNKMYFNNSLMPERLYKIIDNSKKHKLDYIISAPSLNLINKYKTIVEENRDED